MCTSLGNRSEQDDGELVARREAIFNSEAVLPIPGPAGAAIPAPYLIFLGDAKDSLAVKTGQGVVDWRPERVAGQLRFEGCRADLGVRDLTIAEAVAAGARTILLGTVSPGGVLPEEWIGVIVEAIESGMDVASGLHTRLGSFPQVEAAASACGRRLFDVRHAARTFQTGTGEKRSGKRLLTVGTDCSVGKKYAALCLERALRDAGVDADFRATGQTGILITGSGVAVDAVPADFIAGAVEWISPAASDEHWDVIEGQGSLFHPSFGGVSLGLLQGAQPDAVVVCHEPTRTTMRNVSAPLPTIEDVIDLTVRFGRRLNPDITCVGLAINTHALEDDAARSYIEEAGLRVGLPATDPVRYGCGPIVDRLLADSCT